MITLNDFKRLIAPIKRRIFLSLGRGILKAINNSEGTQKIQINVLAGETITDVERFQEYGFETYPLTEAEACTIFFNGNREHGITLCVHDRRYRPKDLIAGEVCMYTDEDSTTEFRFQLKRNRISYLRADTSQEELDTLKSIKADTSTEEITTLKRLETATSQEEISTLKYINCDEITLGSDTRAAVRRLVDDRFETLFNSHVHSGVSVGSGNTGAPTTSVSTSVMTDKVRAL